MWIPIRIRTPVQDTTADQRITSPPFGLQFLSRQRLALSGSKGAYAGMAHIPFEVVDVVANGHSVSKRAETVTDVNDEFELWDLRVEVVGEQEQMVCGHSVGDYLEISGENLTLPARQPFSMYALAAILPLLPAKQRMTDANDWMTTDAEIACPDPHCGARFRITRRGKSTFRHSETTQVPLQTGKQ